jgi:hypothetical protein
MVGMTDVEKEIEEYITTETQSYLDLTEIFTQTKIANIEIMVNIQIDALRKIVDA